MQLDVIRRVYNHHKYEPTDVPEILLSGNVGSSKSLTMAHCIVSHAIRFPNSVQGIGRLALPRLKETLCLKIKEHLHEIGGGLDYKYSETRGSFEFNNGSKILAFSWSDKNFQKFRSYELSTFSIEEATENKGEYKAAYFEAIQRVGRLSRIPEKWTMLATNPDSRSHWVYKHWYLNKKKSRFKYEFRAIDNPFLPKGYIDNLREVLDPREALRMLEGQWLDLNTEVVYHAYERDKNFIDRSYDVVSNVPICVCFDFNIGLGKPLSIAFLQHVKGQTHVFNECVVDGQNTLEALEESYSRGLFQGNHLFIINGDASGRHRDTRSKATDYNIIEQFFMDKKIRFEMRVPKANPGVRERHNLVNGRICNANGERNLLIYKDAPTADEAFSLTKLKKGSSYVEDDSDRYQHIGTAIGYSVCSDLKESFIQGGQVQNLSRFGLR
jgi:hypothetical protein